MLKFSASVELVIFHKVVATFQILIDYLWGCEKLRFETMFAIKTYRPCNFALFFNWLCSLTKVEHLINSLFSVKSKIIIPRQFKEERGQAIGMLAAGGSKKEVAGPF